MKLTLLGGGGFRVPQVFAAIAADDAAVRIDELVLYDTDPDRLGAIRAVIARLEPAFPHAPKVIATTDLDTALTGSAYALKPLSLRPLEWLPGKAFNVASFLGNDLKLDPGIGNCGKAGQWVPVGVGQPTLMIQGLCQMKAGQRAQAEESLARSYELDAGNPITGYNLALLLFQRGELVRAQGFRFVAAGVVNMFPHTAHVESIAVFERELPI